MGVFWKTFWRTLLAGDAPRREPGQCFAKMKELIDQADGSTPLSTSVLEVYERGGPVEQVGINGYALTKAAKMLGGANTPEAARQALARVVNILDGFPTGETLVRTLRQALAVPDSHSDSHWTQLCHDTAVQCVKQASNCSEALRITLSDLQTPDG